MKLCTTKILMKKKAVEIDVFYQYLELINC